jgi:hypothetical protein
VLYTGPDINALVAFTGYLRKVITDVSGRMRAAGLWEADFVHDEDLWEGEELRLAGLVLNGLVASGQLVASRRADGQWLYRLAHCDSMQGSFSFRE